MLSTMQDRPLLVSQLVHHGQTAYPASEVVTFEGEKTRRATFAAVGARAAQLAHALKALGVEEGDRVATFGMNHQEHLEAYLAVPSMGAVLHTLNVRLYPEQLGYIVADAEDKVILFDAALAPALARIPNELKGVAHLVAVGPGDPSPVGTSLAYEELIEPERTTYDWPDLDERAAAAMCYTSGTTGNPKGVVYSHRSTWLHTLMVTSATTLGIHNADKVLVIVPMFHANAWGTPYACWMAGADMIFPKQFLQAEPLTRIFNTEHPTMSAGVPTIWNDLLKYAEDHELDLSTVRLLIAGGSAVPRHLIEAFRERYGVRLLQGWGMTETSPLCALSIPPRGTPVAEEAAWLAKTGKVVAGVDLRVVADDGSVSANDGESVGEFEVRGPWITGSYFKGVDPERFGDGWLRTGDVGSLDGEGNMQISDRAKDVIKTGGEWISSVDLETTIMAHPDVFEAAVIGVPDPRWEERPLAVVVARPGSSPEPAALAAWLDGKVAKWWVPERWAMVEELPKTSVGKFDKKVVRRLYADGALDVVTLER